MLGCGMLKGNVCVMFSLIESEIEMQKEESEEEESALFIAHDVERSDSVSGIAY